MTAHGSDGTLSSPLEPPEHRKTFIEKVPVFINVRDRLSCLKLLLEWLDRAGHRNVILLDNGSAYPPLVEFLRSCPYRTIRLHKNLGHTVLWRLPSLRNVLTTQWFVYTDPDVVPAGDCPLDAVAHLYELLLQFPYYFKAGLGLRLDDIPDHYHLKSRVIEWEKDLYGKEIAPHAFQADVDTTFALYRPRTPYLIGPAIRLRGIYEAHHLPWYVDSAQLDEEERYYRSHVNRGVTTWNTAGDLRPSRSPGQGGVAAQIDDNPQGTLNSLLESKSGRLMLALRPFRRLAGKHCTAWRIGGTTTQPQARQAIIEILTSDEWQAAWRIAEPLRRLQARFR